MEIKKLNVVVGTSNFWDTNINVIKVGMHFLTEHFVDRGANVSFLSPRNDASVCMFLFGLANPKYYYKRAFNSFRAVSATIRQNRGLEVRNPSAYSFASLFRPMRVPILNSYWVAKNCTRFMYPSLKSLKNKLNLDDIDIFMFDPTGIPLYDHVNAKLSIYRYCDIQTSKTPSGLLEYDTEILRKVDVVLPVSKLIYEYVVEKRGNSIGVHYLPNGVDIEKFMLYHSVPSEYMDIPKPIAVYVGNLSYVDWNLCIYVAKALPHISFVFIGKPFDMPSKMPSNIHLLGPKDHNEVPGYLQYSDIGLIPFIDCELIRAIEKPLKFYEYIASGLPVISVSYGAMSSMSPWAKIAKNYDEFVGAIQQSLESPPQYRDELRIAAKEFAWSNIYQKLDEIIGNHLRHIG